MYWLIKHKDSFQNPGQTIPRFLKLNMEKNIFFRQLPLDGFLAKSLRVIKITTKSFPKNLAFGIDFKLWVPGLMHKNKHTQHKRCEKLGRNSD